MQQMQLQCAASPFSDVVLAKLQSKGPGSIILYALSQHDESEAGGHSKHQNGVSDVYVTSLTEYPDDGREKQRCSILVISSFQILNIPK